MLLILLCSLTLLQQNRFFLFWGLLFFIINDRQKGFLRDFFCFHLAWYETFLVSILIFHEHRWFYKIIAWLWMHLWLLMRCAQPWIEDDLDIIMIRPDMTVPVFHYVWFLGYFLGDSSGSAVDIDVKLVELCQFVLYLLVQVWPIYGLVGTLQPVIFLLITSNSNILIFLQLSTLHRYLLQSLYHLILGVKLQCFLETSPCFFVFLFLH